MTERERMLRAERSRWLHGGQLRLPTADQICVAAGTWDRALAHAGLAPRPKAGKGRGAHLTIIDLLDRCYEAHGTEPTVGELEVFARANGIPHPRRERGRLWASYIAEWKDERRLKGLRVPTGPPPRGERPDYARDVGAGFSGERRSPKNWELEELVGWVTLFLRQLRRGVRPTAAGYNRWSAAQEGAPWVSVLIRNGGWAQVRDAAWERLRTVSTAKSNS